MDDVTFASTTTPYDKDSRVVSVQVKLDSSSHDRVGGGEEEVDGMRVGTFTLDFIVSLVHTEYSLYRPLRESSVEEGMRTILEARRCMF